MTKMTLELFWPGALSLSLPAEFRVDGEVVGEVVDAEPADVAGTPGHKVKIEVSPEEYSRIVSAVNPVDNRVNYSISQ